MIEGVVPHYSPRAKRLALRVDVKGGVIRLVIPRRVSDKRAWDFALTHQEWIDRRLSDLPRPVAFVHGAIVPVFGVDRMIVHDTAGGRVPQFELQDTQLVVRTSRTDIAGPVKRYLTALALERITEAVQSKLSVGDGVRKILIRDQKSRWGSCSADGTLCFSWRLVLAPPAVLDYVVAHEVAHLTHLDHSPAFWALCRALSGQFTFGQHWLKINGSSLTRYSQTQNYS